MKKRRIDRQQDLFLSILRPFVYVWMKMDAKRRIHMSPELSFKRMEPFIMLANHTFLFDVIHVPLRFKNVPYIVASQTLFTKQPTKFFVTQVAHVVPKSKGASDLKTVRELIGAVRRGYPILIFPEGDTTFYGETGHIEFSTMKLVKKLEIDVVTCKVKGGYLSKPRWATGKRRNRRIELDYRIAIRKEDIQKMSLEEINDIITRELNHNDYIYQKEKMIPHPGRKLAEGIENVVYVCPHCQAINTLKSEGNQIRCDACKRKGYLDRYGFIHDFVFDNLVAWDTYQRNFTKQLKEATIRTQGFLSFLNVEDESHEEKGKIELIYENHRFHLTGAYEEIIEVDAIENPTITLRRSFGFFYQNRHYLIDLEQYGASLLRIAQNKY